MQVRPLGWEDFLGWEKAMATHSSVLAWKTPWTEKPGELYIGHEVIKSGTRLK